jgi:hypothetical protein
MNLIVQGIVPPSKIESLRASPEAAQLPAGINVTFAHGGHPTAGVGMVLAITGGTHEQQQQVFDWWEAALTGAGFQTGLG